MCKAGLLCMLTFGLLAAAGGAALAAPGKCAELQSQLAALEMADRDQWERSGSTDDPYAIERQRLAVLKALAANRCRSPEAKRDRRPNRLFAGLFGNKRPFRDGGFGEGRLFGNGLFGNDFRAGTYRTLCVRSCDGYYFPISFSASGHELQRDETACRALCPGQEVALYVQPNPGDEGGPMVSLAGQPYAALATAFRYRSEYDRTCACGPIDAHIAAAFQIFSVPAPGTVPASETSEPARQIIPQPTPRIREDDPDTIANRAGGFDIQPAERRPHGVAAYRESADGRIVRLVGPISSHVGE